MHIRSTSIDVLFVNWRQDITHPEGGGSERYVHRIAEGLAGPAPSLDVLRCPRPGAGRRRHRRCPHRPPRRTARRLPAGPAARAAAPPAAGGRRPERPALRLLPGHRPAGGRPGPPRAPRAVADLFGRLGGALGWWWSRSWPRGSTGAAVTSPCPRPRRRARRARDRPRPALRGAQRRGAGPAGDLGPSWPRPTSSCWGGWSRTSGSSTRSRWSPGCATGGRACACPWSVRAGGTPNCAPAPPTSASPTSWTSPVTSTSRPSTRS